MKPLVIEVYVDNGELSYYALINKQTGEKLWSQNPAECKAMGYPVIGNHNPNVDRQTIMDKIGEIQELNYNKFKGSNEADLHTREEIADLFQTYIKDKDSKFKELKIYANILSDAIRMNDIEKTEYSYSVLLDTYKVYNEYIFKNILKDA